ncbi:MAG: polysaccharide deacetylase family protein [Clostridia bacterium]
MRQKQRTKGSIAVDVLLLLIMCALYFVTNTQDAQTVMARAYYAPVYRGQAEDKAALQFEVSWNAAAIEPILDTLKETGNHVTFAVSGQWAQANPALLVRMASQGHEIATMGYDVAFDGRLSAVTEDVQRSMKIIEQLCGCPVRLYYSGDRDVAVSARAAKKAGLTQVLCTVDLMCARGSAEDIILRVSTDPIKGSIILAQPTANAAAALGGIIAALDEKGLEVVRTSDVLQNGFF